MSSVSVVDEQEKEQGSYIPGTVMTSLNLRTLAGIDRRGMSQYRQCQSQSRHSISIYVLGVNVGPCQKP